MAEEIFRQKVFERGLGEQFEIDSAGTYSGHAGELADPRMREAAHCRGYCLTHRSRPFRISDFDDFDRIIVMDDGRVAMDGTPKEVFTQVEELRSMGLTVPDTVDLLDRLRHNGVDVPLDALTVEECADVIAQAMTGN